MLVDIVFLTLFLIDTAVPATPGWGGDEPPTFLRSKTKKGKPREKRTIFKADIIERLSPRSNIFLLGQLWWQKILFSVPWPLHFEIHFARSVLKK